MLIALALSFGFAACGGPAVTPTWKKVDATEATIASDTAQCRATARQQAARLYPYACGSPTLGGAGMIAAQQQANTDRFSAELEMFNDCMQAKGYTR
jgi:hypothetical protein